MTRILKGASPRVLVFARHAVMLNVSEASPTSRSKNRRFFTGVQNDFISTDAARHAQRGADGGEDAYQGLDDQTPNVFFVHDG